MNYLLDTHSFIWMASAAERLSDSAQAAITDAESVLFLSLASVWV